MLPRPDGCDIVRTMKVELSHTGGMAFRGQAGRHEFVLDTSMLGGQDTGPTPKQMLLASILGCTGMDVVPLFRKFRQNVSAVKLTAETEQTETHPKVFQEILVTFDVTGEGIDPAKIQEAVELSLTKYCGVSAMVSKVSPIAYRIMLNGQETARGHAQFWN